MTYPPGGQPPYGEPEYSQQGGQAPFGQPEPSEYPPPGGAGFAPQQGQEYRPQGGQGYPPQGGQGYPVQGGQGYPAQGGQGYPVQGGQGYLPQGGQGFSPQGYPPQGGAGYPPANQYPRQGYPPSSYPPGYQQRPAKKRRTGLIIGLLVLVLVIAGAVTGGVVLTLQGKTPLASDEKKIEVAIHDYYDALGSAGFSAASAKACQADRAEFDSLSVAEREQFDSAKVSVRIEKIEDIVVTGDRATAVITGELTLTLPGETPDTDTGTTEHLRKEDGRWKVCAAESGRN